MKIAIYGIGGCGRDVAPLVRAQAKNVLFVSDFPEDDGRAVNGIRAVSFSRLCAEFRDHAVVIAIAEASARRRLAERCRSAGLSFASVVADTHRRYDDVQVGEGAIFCDFTTCTSNIKIGAHFHANLYSYVTHDCVIGDFVTLAPRVGINGRVIVEDNVFIGAGAVIRNGTSEKPLRIGRGAVVGMGAVVTKDVPAETVVLGNPARELKK